MLKLSDFDYALPKALIAQYPLKEREAARLLILDRTKQAIEHRYFRDIPDYLGREDLLVLNDTKVLPSRLIGRRHSGGRVEILLLGEKGGVSFKALIRPARVKIGEEIIFDGAKAVCTVTGKNEVSFLAQKIEDVYDLGRIPLPPYIKRQPEDIDNVYYQTIYASNEGSIAAPTAGLHFSPEVISKIRSHGTGCAYITLHINYSTFKPVKTEDIKQHKMEPEYFFISDESKDIILKHHRQEKKIVAVGTTSLRVLETLASGCDKGFTDLFIYPGYEFKMAGALLTNFHLPRTTLFMLVCAFAGTDLAHRVYEEAVRQEYRFYSYGDAMLIV